MDRRNGGDPLAPPRPPKLQPRVHRPRAPEPATAATAAAAAIATLSGNNNSSNLQVQLPQQHPSITTSTATTNNNIISITPASADFDDYQIHHLTFLPQRPSSLSRNSSNASSSTATANSSTGSTSSFTRRRPPVPLLSINSSSSNHNTNNNNFLSHFQSAEPASLLSTGQPPASPVTLAQPRPESERLTNEYVDTPLQHATRAQHPAGQQDNGATTTHHLLLLPQRHHQTHSPTPTAAAAIAAHQQHPQGQHNNNRLATTTTTATTAAGSATSTSASTAAAGIDGIDGLLHSHLQPNPAQHPHHLRPHQLNGHTKAPASHFASLPPPAPPRNALGLGMGFASVASAQPITQPITKQPGAAGAASSKEHMHALEELLQQQQQQQSLPGSGGQLGAPIVLGGDPALLNPIVCPRCNLCRCEQCQSPRPLPQTWVCNKTCLCSAESIIDYASCLCCAKALFYHCARDNDMDCDDGNGTPCVDNPCSCGPYKRTQRWGWLGALSIVLPCLWCYWPMRGCIKLCERCYARFAGRGCRCQGSGAGSNNGGIGSTSSMMPIVPLGGIGGNLNGSGANGTQNGGVQANGKGFDHGCSAASRILRKGDLTPEKRLLDSSPDY